MSIRLPSIQKCLLFEKQETLLFPPAPKAALSEASQYKDACCLRNRKGGQKSPHFGVTGSISSPPVASWSGKCGETSLGVTQLLSVCGLSRCRTIQCISLEYQYISPLLYWHFIFCKRLQSKGGFELVTPVIAD